MEKLKPVLSEHGTSVTLNSVFNGKIIEEKKNGTSRLYSDYIFLPSILLIHILFEDFYTRGAGTAL